MELIFDVMAQLEELAWKHPEQSQWQEVYDWLEQWIAEQKEGMGE